MKSQIVTGNIFTEVTDDRLVALGLGGDRLAFGELVRRYQSPVCAIAYSVCGDISQSEDLAQETFIAAWKKLGELREAAKFKMWLCGIARNLSKNFIRGQKRNPLAGADLLDEAVPELRNADSPTAEMMTREEEGILWRTLEQIPLEYREPLILFYREQQSVERVAAALDLSEEAVRQRLSRGRKLVQARVMAMFEGALRRSEPGPSFTVNVIAALPMVSVAASTTAVGAATGKAVASVSILTLLKSLLIKLAPPLIWMWLNSKILESNRERRFARKAFGVILLGAVMYPIALYALIHLGRNYWDVHPQALNLTMIGSTFGFVAVLAPYAFWMARMQSRIRRAEAIAQSADSRFVSQSAPYEFRSRSCLLGLPLVHIRFNCQENGRTLPAIGWIAGGNRACGVLFAFGAVAVGAISSGGVAIGLLGLGGIGLGLFAFGGLAVGVMAMGGAAAGYLAFGGGAIGWLAASGGAALARHYAIGGSAIALHANDEFARAFADSNAFFRNTWTIFDVLIVCSWLVPPILTLYFKRRRERSQQPTRTI